MDLNDIRIAFTLISLLCFVGIVWSTLRRSRRHEFEEAARLPFAEDGHQEDRP